MTVSVEPTVSICIPAYKPDYFEECLQSCLMQRYPFQELVISDDCPTDAIEQIVKKYAAEPRIRYYRNIPSLGLARNYVRLAELASCEWLKFMDDDDILQPNGLALLMEKAAGDVAVVCGGQREFYEDGKIVEKLSDIPDSTGGVEYLLAHFRKRPIVGFSKILIRKAAFAEVDFDHDPFISEKMMNLDRLIGGYACLLGKVVRQSAVVCAYRRHSSSYSKKTDADIWKYSVEYVYSIGGKLCDKNIISRYSLQRWQRQMVSWELRCAMDTLLRRGDGAAVKEFISYIWMRFSLGGIWHAIKMNNFTKIINKIFWQNS